MALQDELKAKQLELTDIVRLQHAAIEHLQHEVQILLAQLKSQDALMLNIIKYLKEKDQETIGFQLLNYVGIGQWFYPRADP